MTEFTESFSTIGANDAWHALAVNAAFPPALQNAFSALDAGTRAIATALRTSVAGLELARRVARTVDANPAEIALREALSEIDTFLAELAVNGGPTVHVLFVPLNRKKALPGTQVMAQSFRDTTVEFLRGAADQDAASLVNGALSQTAGMGGFLRTVYTSLADGGDSRRPLFPASFATAGVCLVAGGETYADLVVPARLLAGMFDTRRSRLPLLNHVETVPQNVRVTPIPGVGSNAHAVIRWDAVPPINQIPIGRADVIHNDEIVVVCVEGDIAPGESLDWESLFAGVVLSDDRTSLPRNLAGNARVIARLRNHGMTQSYTDTRDLDARKQRRYVVYLRERQVDPRSGDDKFFMSPPSGAVWMPRTGSSSTRSTRGTPPDWFAVPSVLQALPKLEQGLAEVRTQMSRAASYTAVHTGAGQILDRALTTAEQAIAARAAEVTRVTAVTSQLNALASSTAAVSTGLHTILLTSARGGMSGWMAALAKSLSDTTDPGRPIYSTSAPVIGVVLVAGAPRLPQLASIIALFRLLFGSKKKHPLADLVRQLDPPPVSASPAAPSATAPVAFDAAFRPVTTPQC